MKPNNARSGAANASTRCRACGFDQAPQLPWGEDGNSPAYLICPCCGAESGLDEVTAADAAAYRDAWVKKGKAWFRPELMPKGWSWEKQKALIPDQT
jgi:hypothetical protein